MAHRLVDSTMIRSADYNPITQEFEVIFKNSPTPVRYFGVSTKESEDFFAAESKGRYLNAVIKPNHAFAKGER